MAYLGKTPSQAVRSRYYFTASGGETSLSGTDDNSNTLTFTDGNYVDVSLNGVALVAGTDYNTTTANTIGGLTALVASDVVEVVVYDTFSVFSGEFRGDISLGDNVKAKFGASDDLQIYHDGSNSYINESGTGNLFIDAANYLTLRNTNGESYVAAQANGYVQLFYNGSQKLATTSTGADITGTLTADGLTVDGDGKISSTAPKLFLTETDTVDVNTRITSTGGVLYFQSSNDAENAHITRQTIDHSTGDISFYEDTGTTAKFFWDASAESLGIGTSSVNNKLTIEGSATLNPYYATYLANSYYDSAWKYAGNGVAWGIGNNFGGVTNGTTIAVASSNSSGSGAALTWNPAFNIDSSGNVGIGTSSPATPLDVTKAGGGNFVATFQNTTSATPYGVHIKDAASGANGYPLFQVTDSAGSQAYLRVDSGTGNTTLGSFNASGGSVGVLFDIGGGTSETEIQTSVNGTATRTHYKFINNNGAVGTITTNGSATAFNTSSDHRLKENVTDVTDGITRVKQLEPKRFNFIADPDTTVDGFLAHEAQAVVPEAVTGTHNEVDDDGNAVMQGIDQSKLVPLLTAALKEAITKIETLETEMTSVKARLDALEAN